MTCKDCKYLENIGRTNKLFSSTKTSRKEYMCTHPKTLDLIDKRGFKLFPFVGYGDCTNESPLQLKTCKRWCPLKEQED